MYVLLEDHQGTLTLQRLRPWHRMTAWCLAARLDCELAGGARPEGAPSLAARATRLTSMKSRRDLARSLQRIMAAAGLPPAEPRAVPIVARQPHIPLRRARIRRSAPELAALVGHLVRPGPVPVQGVAIVSQLLADGRGPLYRVASRDDLSVIVERAARALSLVLSDHVPGSS